MVETKLNTYTTVAMFYIPCYKLAALFVWVIALIYSANLINEPKHLSSLSRLFYNGIGIGAERIINLKNKYNERTKRH